MPNGRLVLPANIQAQDWEVRKKRIKRLYLEKGYTLRVVKKKMETPDFQPSESQYRTRFKTWGFQKARKDKIKNSSSVHRSQSSSSTSEPFYPQDAIHSSTGPQRSTSEFSFQGSSQWSPVAGQIDSARVSEAPIDSDFDRADHFDTSHFPEPCWNLRSDYHNPLADMVGPASDFSPLLLPLDEPSGYHSQLNDVPADYQHARSSLQLHKPVKVCTRSSKAQRKQPLGISLPTPSVSETSEGLPWIPGENLQIELPYFGELEEIPDTSNLGIPDSTTIYTTAEGGYEQYRKRQRRIAVNAEKAEKRGESFATGEDLG
ncbi:hypothetical protein MMC29_006874 [Sticta canariensis]|nr:hypothetical protein [Sticta canariensis]